MKLSSGLIGVLTIVASCKKNVADQSIPSVTTTSVTNITQTSARGGGTIINEGGSAITVSGIVFSTSSTTPTIADSIINANVTAGSFSVILNNLNFSDTYYVRAFATNGVGTGYGNVVTLITVNDTTQVRFEYMGQTVTYGIIISSQTGRKWLDRNLGAGGVASNLNDTSGFGHLFQWGRIADGHQYRNSELTFTLANSDVAGHNKFIVNPAVPNDWRSPQNHLLWSGSNGINNPCPSGWRLPKESEWNAENITSTAIGYARLKMPLAGYRERFNGAVSVTGLTGIYWTGGVNSDPDMNGQPVYHTKAQCFFLTSQPVGTGTGASDRAGGMSVRCIKD